MVLLGVVGGCWWYIRVGVGLLVVLLGGSWGLLMVLLGGGGGLLVVLLEMVVGCWWY